MDYWSKNLPPVQSYFQSADDVGSNKPPLPGRKKPDDPWTRTDVIERVKVAMMIELSTIPLYLYAMYSVKSTDQAHDKLRDILLQEMLHLALAGNILSALGGSLDLYNFDVVPNYLSHILMDKIPMTLRAFDAESLDYFIKIESPSHPPPQVTLINNIEILTQDYKSIGDFYEDVIKGVNNLTDEDFANNPDCQFTKDDNLGSDITTITNKAAAVKAMILIIEQGEGYKESDDSHFHTFTELKKTLQSNPSAWEVRPVPENPQTVKYDSGSYISKLSLAFDAAYCYLLQTIQRVWRKNKSGVRGTLVQNIGYIMSDILTPLAEILVQQEWKGGVAAPCFNYYAMIGDVGADLIDNKDPLTPEELYKQLSNRMKDTVNAAPDAKQKGKLEEISSSVDDVQPPA